MKAMAQTCSECGQPTLPESAIALPHIKQTIFNAVRKCPGISAERLRGLVWADDPNGGPEDRKVLHVHVSQLNALLRPHGLQVRGHQTLGYRLVQCEPEQP